jgi:hypothetical protein
MSYGSPKLDEFYWLRRKLREERAISAALQQSLNEATARIEALTAQLPQPTTWSVGDMARHKRSGNAYTITAIDRDEDRTFAQFQGYEYLSTSWFNLDRYEKV